MRWTVAFRKAHKKGSAGDSKLKKKKRVVKKVQRAYAGVNMELLAKVKRESPEERLARNSENLK